MHFTTFALCALLVAAGQSDVRTKSVHDYVEMGVSYINIAAPKHGIQPEDVERWAAILNAAEEQQEFMRLQYGAYADRYNAHLDRVAPQYLEECAQTNAIVTGTGRSNESVKVLAFLLRSSKRLWADLEQLDNEYLDSISPALTEEQIAQLAVCRGEISRRNSRTSRFLTRWADMELRMVWGGSGQ